MSKFPVYLAGMRLTAALLSSGQPDVVVKTANTIRASNITFTDDPELTINLPLVGSYLVEFHIKYASTVAAGFQTKWNVAATTSSPNRRIQGLGAATPSAAISAQDNTPDATNFSMRQGVHAFGTVTPYGTRNSVTSQVHAIEQDVVDVTSAGNVTLQWCQLVSTAVNTTVFPGSFVRATRLI